MKKEDIACNGCLCFSCKEKGQYEDCECPCPNFPNPSGIVIGCCLRGTHSTSKTAAEYCREYGISSLYHITPLENIPSILQYGLKCHEYANKDGLLRYSCSDANVQDLRKDKFLGGMNAYYYVPLFFSEKPPMLWNIEHNKEHFGRVIVYICIGGEIIGKKGIYFSDGNIASQSTKAYSNLSDLNKLDWEGIRMWNPEKLGSKEATRIKSAEVLVPFVISPSWFQKVIVPDREAKAELESSVTESISIEIKPEFYFTVRGHRRY